MFVFLFIFLFDKQGVLWWVNDNFEFLVFVTYWPLTEPSIKRCTCVNKRKKGESRWASNKNITRTQTAWVSWSWSQLGTRCRSESQRQTEGFGPSVTHSWATQPRWERSAAMVRTTLPLTHNKHQPFRE